MVLMDASGSLSDDEWAKEKSFVLDFVESRLVGPDADHIGLGAFATTAELLLPLEDNLASIVNVANAAVSTDGSTCIPCALDLAATEFAANGRPDTDKITLILTDGQNNVGVDDLADSIAALQAISTVIAIGVGDAVSAQQLEDIASDVDGLQTTYTVPDFNELVGLMDQLTSSLGSTAAVPAPSAVLIFVIGAAAILRRRRPSR